MNKEHSLDPIKENREILPLTQGITIDVPNGNRRIFDAEQGYSVYLIDDNHAKINIHIANPWSVIDQNPTLIPQALTNLETEYIEGVAVRPMWPDEIVEGIALTPNVSQPVLTIEAIVNLQDGQWSNSRIYESRFTNQYSFTYAETEARFSPLTINQNATPSVFELYRRIAERTTLRRFGAENSQGIIKKNFVRDTSYPYSEFVVGALSELAGEIIAYESLEHQVPILYWNLIDPAPSTDVYPSSPYKVAEPRELPFVEEVSQIFIPPRDTDWIKSKIPFADTSVWRHEKMSLPWYTRCTAPARDVRSLITVVNWVAKLRGVQSPFKDEQLKETARAFSHKKRDEVIAKRQQNTVRQREASLKRYTDKIKASFDERYQDVQYWFEAFPGFYALETGQKEKLVHLFEGKHQFSSTQLQILNGILSRYKSLTHTKHRVDVRNDQGNWTSTLILLDEHDEEVASVKGSGTDSKKAKSQALQNTVLFLLRQIVQDNTVFER